MSLKRGMFRLWIVLSIVWTVIFGTVLGIILLNQPRDQEQHVPSGIDWYAVMMGEDPDKERKSEAENTSRGFEEALKSAAENVENQPKNNDSSFEEAYRIAKEKAGKEREKKEKEEWWQKYPVVEEKGRGWWAMAVATVAIWLIPILITAFLIPGALLFRWVIKGFKGG